MEKIIPKIDRKKIKEELNEKTFLRKTNNGNNEIYIINEKNAPNTLKEIGRLREITFRYAGGGTGKSIDLDEFDTGPFAYEQLLVWNPADEEIVGSYRFKICKDAIDANGTIHLATTKLFHFSNKFIKDYLPYTIELGRSFVQPDYQPSESFRKGLFSLDNLWDGLGALVVDHPDIRYFFGKVTMYTDFDRLARDLILSFLRHYFPDRDDLVRPIRPIHIENDTSDFLNKIKNLPYKEGHTILNKMVRERGENIPPLVNAYMNLSLTMRSFGTALNEGFGGVEETGLMVTIADIYPSKKERHINSYLAEKGIPVP
ncbi:MAG: GNAT family N-acetyltransferase [Bacteroidia bacterium]|nr:GNAT family N-acetyltransferase [Bacteroidia bacterium]